MYLELITIKNELFLQLVSLTEVRIVNRRTFLLFEFRKEAVTNGEQNTCDFSSRKGLKLHSP
jgi:hypothetical protein